jgi:hypothetical protein
MLLKEHRFTFFAGGEIHLFRIEEMVSGLAIWPQRFRLKLPASARSEAKTIYASSCDEVAQKAADILDGRPPLAGTASAKRMAPGRPGLFQRCEP